MLACAIVAIAIIAILLAASERPEPRLLPRLTKIQYILFHLLEYGRCAQRRRLLYPHRQHVTTAAAMPSAGHARNHDRRRENLAGITPDQLKRSPPVTAAAAALKDVHVRIIRDATPRSECATTILHRLSMVVRYQVIHNITH